MKILHYFLISSELFTATPGKLFQHPYCIPGPESSLFVLCFGSSAHAQTVCEHPVKPEGWELHLQQLSWQESLLQLERSFCPSAHTSSPSTLTFLPLREWLPEQPGVVLLIPEPGVHQDFSQRRTGNPAALAGWIEKRRGTLLPRENLQGLKRKKSPEEPWCQCLPDTSCPAHAAGAGLGAALEDPNSSFQEFLT